MTYTKEKFYQALHQVESSGKLSPPDGDSGKAIGPFQIWSVYWQDSNIGGSYDDVRQLDTAKKCVDGYMKRYAKNEWSEQMSIADVEKCARIHNGGPKGYTKSSTDGYWAKFSSHL
eukprot:TRINITY_DN3176_c0_g1_i1.p1 TRINITY_DN3176_c0_g1~~TRINITY_DN3176_c0_g1_i1.p1  ORF type:complete len:116 (-),score=19.67 TRINITY_DN3176_c0_g1_i1:233-580(-)